MERTQQQTQLASEFLAVPVDVAAMSAEITDRMKKAQAFAKAERARLEELKSDLPALFESVGVHQFLVTVTAMDRMGLGVDWLNVIRVTKYHQLAYRCFYDSNSRMHERDVREFFGDRPELLEEFTALMNKNYNSVANPGGAFDFDDKSEFAFLPPPMFGLVNARFKLGGVVRKILDSDALPENKELVFLHHVDRWLAPKFAPYIEAIVGFVSNRLEPTTVDVLKGAFQRAVT